MTSYNDDAFDSYNTKALEPCPNCGRTFLPESLVKHQKMCKGSSISLAAKTGTGNNLLKRVGLSGDGPESNPILTSTNASS